MGYRAVYRDANDRTYSAPLEWDAASSSYLMRTNEGLQQIVYLFRDDEVGNLFFKGYREDAPTPTAETDTRLRVEGQGFRALQEAVAKERLRREAERASRRAETLTAMNKPDARKIQQARAINNQFAQKLKPTREAIPPPATQLDKVIGIDETRLHKKAEKARRDQE